MPSYALDEDIAGEVGRLLAVGSDVATTRRLGRRRARDPNQPTFSARSGRALVTRNWNAYSLLHEAWLTRADEWGITDHPAHAGIVAVPNENEINPAPLARPLAELAHRRTALSDQLWWWRPGAGWRESRV